MSVETGAPSSTIASHNNLAALKQIAALYNSRHQPLGLYVTHVEPDINIRFVSRTGPRGVCIWVEEVQARITLSERTIHIAREYHRNSCEYQAILNHELKHAQTDDAVLKTHIPRIEQAIRDAAAQSGVLGPMQLQGINQAQHQSRTAVAAAFGDAVNAMLQDRAQRQSQVDTPEEYRRVAASCPSGLRLDR